MNHRAYRAKFILLILCALLPGILTPATAQEESSVPLIVIEDEIGVGFYSVINNNELKRVGGLPPEFTLDSVQNVTQDSEKDWWLRICGDPYESPNLVLSPDQQQIAFTARWAKSDSVMNFFILNLQTDEAKGMVSAQFDEAGNPRHNFKLMWSPDSQEVLWQNYVPCDFSPSTPPYPEIYVYELQSEDWRSITNTPDKGEYSIVWKSDGQAIAYASHSGDFYVVDREGNNRRMLVDSAVGNPNQAYDSTCNYIWNPHVQRWYYVLGCLGLNDDPFDYVYSVDEYGEKRVEAALPDGLLQDFPDSPYIEDVEVIDIHPMSEGSYVAFGYKAFVQSELNPNDRFPASFWSVLKINQPEHTQTLFTLQSEWYELSVALYSPMETQVALANNQYIAIADLTTGTQIAGVELQMVYGNYAALDPDMYWLDNQSLLYTTDVDVWLLDTHDGTITNLTADIEARAFLLPHTNSY